MTAYIASLLAVSLKAIAYKVVASNCYCTAPLRLTLQRTSHEHIFDACLSLYQAVPIPQPASLCPCKSIDVGVSNKTRSPLKVCSHPSSVRICMTSAQCWDLQLHLKAEPPQESILVLRL